jgi:hypothetical protein
MTGAKQSDSAICVVIGATRADDVEDIKYDVDNSIADDMKDFVLVINSVAVVVSIKINLSFIRLKCDD